MPPSGHVRGSIAPGLAGAHEQTLRVVAALAAVDAFRRQPMRGAFGSVQVDDHCSLSFALARSSAIASRSPRSTRVVRHLAES